MLFISTQKLLVGVYITNEFVESQRRCEYLQTNIVLNSTSKQIEEYCNYGERMERKIVFAREDRWNKIKSR